MASVQQGIGSQEDTRVTKRVSGGRRVIRRAPSSEWSERRQAAWGASTSWAWRPQEGRARCSMWRAVLDRLGRWSMEGSVCTLSFCYNKSGLFVVKRERNMLPMPYWSVPECFAVQQRRSQECCGGAPWRQRMMQWPVWPHTQIPHW